jgi:peptidoglycan/LPS O-acetylase OafA/YrhL
MSSSKAETRSAGSRFRLGYRPQLDGMRAFAVIGVMGFHASITGTPGGYLGVEVFFVLSGFLITTLLTQERESTGDIRLRSFYARRALRLLPALALFLVVAAAYALLRPDVIEVQDFWRDFVATVAYVANWSLAFKPTFDTRLLTHTWTLAVEEQFYLLWPLALVLLLARTRGRSLAFAVAAGGAVASTSLRLLMFYGDTSLPRLAWGLDTRAGALLLGAALGLAATSGWLPRSVAFARVAAIAAFAWLVYIFLSSRYGIAEIGRDPGREFVEGVLVADVASAVLLVGLLLDGQGPVSRLFSLSPIVWIGKVSYGLYLWHPAVDLVLTPDRTGLSTFANQALRLAVLAGLVVTSYYLVEVPCLRLKRRFERRKDVEGGVAELVDAPLPARPASADLVRDADVAEARRGP